MSQNQEEAGGPLSDRSLNCAAFALIWTVTLNGSLKR